MFMNKKALWELQDYEGHFSAEIRSILLFLSCKSMWNIDLVKN